ncbi:hypothetical protein OH458_15820 [Vibrio sp. MarTm2]|uniref:hypothetical protein n=1 Tax=Vibrio sp. MarTm2 TaxID=2998831 RepID=UPI0022CD2A78|nr:hypothetical protein [Vibrio sp. MarTm2]MDA0129538.1 hypothetical protein [Vibrio sp. MarTm2]
MRETHFLNIDLDIESSRDIRPLVEYWGDQVMVFRVEKVADMWFGSFETCETSEDAIVNQYYQLVTRLPQHLRKLWDSASKRVFDVGFEALGSTKAFQSSLTQESVTKLAEIGGAITISIYSNDDV